MSGTLSASVGRQDLVGHDAHQVGVEGFEGRQPARRHLHHEVGDRLETPKRAVRTGLQSREHAKSGALDGPPLGDNLCCLKRGFWDVRDRQFQFEEDAHATVALSPCADGLCGSDIDS